MRTILAAALALSCLFAFPVQAQPACAPATTFVMQAGSQGLSVDEMDAATAADYIAETIEKLGPPPSGKKLIGVIVIYHPANPLRAVVAFVAEDRTVCDVLTAHGPVALDAISRARRDASF